MSLLTAIDINASGMTAQRRRVEVSTTNLANARTTRTEEGGPYRRQDVVFKATAFEQTLNAARGGWSPKGVEVVEVIDDPTDFIRTYEPGHPGRRPGRICLLPEREYDARNGKPGERGAQLSGQHRRDKRAQGDDSTDSGSWTMSDFKLYNDLQKLVQPTPLKQKPSEGEIRQLPQGSRRRGKQTGTGGRTKSCRNS